MKLNKGDYVVATKYSDGDPKDQFCIGFFDSMTQHANSRYIVVDGEGRRFRNNGFRRARRIRQSVGKKLVDNLKMIEESDRSVWSFVRQYEREHDSAEIK